jgi:hypothetical protein
MHPSRAVHHVVSPELHRALLGLRQSRAALHPAASREHRLPSRGNQRSSYRHRVPSTPHRVPSMSRPEPLRPHHQLWGRRCWYSIHTACAARAPGVNCPPAGCLRGLQPFFYRSVVRQSLYHGARVNKRQQNQFQSIRGGIGALAGMPDAPEFSGIGRLRDEMTEHAATLHELSIAQELAVRVRAGAAAEVRSLTKDLRIDHLIPIVRRARRVFKHESSMIKVLRVPRVRATALKHAHAALAIVKVLRPHVAFCQTEGFRPGFLTRLREAATELRAKAKRVGQCRADLTRTTWRIRQELREAREAMSIIGPELRALGRDVSGAGPVAKVAESLFRSWSNAAKVGKRIGRPRARRNAKEPVVSA